jgi:DNA-directed RNA polymerase specialized sigma24 family protein
MKIEELEHLARAALANDDRAREVLAQHLSVGLRRYFRASWGEDIADDLAQRTLVVMLEKMGGFEPRGEHAFVHWVYAIAHRETLTRLRILKQTERLASALAKVDAAPARRLSSLVLMIECFEMAEEELVHLTEAQRLAISNFLAKARGEEPGPAQTRPVLQRALTQLGRRVRERMSTPETSPSPA